MSPTMAVACKKGHVNVVKILLLNGMSPCMTDEVGHSPISIAALHGNAKLCAFLVESNANIQSLTNDMRRPLGWAADAGNSDCVKVLLEHDRDLEWRDQVGRTALSLACA